MSLPKLQKAEKLLAQCPGCGAVKYEFGEHYHWQHSLGSFKHLPSEKRYPCKKKDGDDNEEKS